LIELAGEFSIGDIELEKTMTWRQGHFIDQRRVPCRYDQAPRIGISMQHLEKIRNLIDMAAIRRRP